MRRARPRRRSLASTDMLERYTAAGRKGGGQIEGGADSTAPPRTSPQLCSLSTPCCLPPHGLPRCPTPQPTPPPPTHTQPAQTCVIRRLQRGEVLSCFAAEGQAHGGAQPRCLARRQKRGVCSGKAAGVGLSVGRGRWAEGGRGRGCLWPGSNATLCARPSCNPAAVLQAGGSQVLTSEPRPGGRPLPNAELAQPHLRAAAAPPAARRAAAASGCPGSTAGHLQWARLAASRQTRGSGARTRVRRLLVGPAVL